MIQTEIKSYIKRWSLCRFVKNLDLVIITLVLVSTVVGIYGWVGQGLPEKQEKAYGEKTVEGNIPLSNATGAFWWAGVWTVVGALLSLGFFSDKPLWPEKAVMIPSVGFLAAGFTYSVMKGIGLIGGPKILTTTNFYVAVAVWGAVGIGTGIYRGDNLW